MADLTTVATAFPANQANLAAVIANTPFTGSYGTVTVTSNQLNVLCDTTFNNGGQTGEIYTWNGTGFYFQVTPAPKGGASTAQNTYCAIADGSSTDDSIRMSWVFNTAPGTPTLVASHYNVDNTYTDPQGAVSINYSAVTHAWVGFYYDASNMYWMTSPDGTTWTQRRSSTRETWLTTQSDITFIFSTNRTAGSNTTALLDNVNTGGTPPGTSLVRSPQPFSGYPQNNVLASFW